MNYVLIVLNSCLDVIKWYQWFPSLALNMKKETRLQKSNTTILRALWKTDLNVK